jgi:predicted dehydrogenase
MNKIKFAVIGFGNIGSRHCAVIDANNKAELVAVCDTDLSKQLSVTSLYPGAKFFTDYQEMISHCELDVVSICTPHDLHADMSVAVARHKINILVEKPMALTSDDCQRMIDEANLNKVKLTVVKQNRFNVPVSLVRQLITDGALGQIYQIQCNVFWNRNPEYYSLSEWRGKKSREGGCLYTQASHFIDLILWLFGDVELVSGQVARSKQLVDIEDCGVAHLKFKNGAVGTLNWTTAVHLKNYEGSITIFAEKGSVKIGGEYLNKLEHCDVRGFAMPDEKSFNDKPNSYGKYQGTSSNHDKVIEQLILLLSKDASEVVFGEEGKKTVEFIESVYQHSNYNDL